MGYPDGLTYKQWGCIWPTVIEAKDSKIKGLRAFANAVCPLEAVGVGVGTSGLWETHPNHNSKQ